MTLTLATPATPRAAAISARRSASICDLAGIAELDVEGHVAAGVDAHVAQLLGGDEIAAGLGVDDGLEGLEEIGFVDGHVGWGARRRPVPRQSSARSVRSAARSARRGRSA